MTTCRACGDDVDPGYYVEIEYPTDDGFEDALAGQLCDKCADWLALEVTTERSVSA